MSKILLTGGAGGALSDECTATLADIPSGLRAVALDSDDDIGVGTMSLTGDAVENHVLAGSTFYTTDYKTKLTGTMTVNSLLSFSVAANSGRRVLATWKNPTAADGKPYSGVYIRYSTSGYPGKTGGTQIYKGAGNNTTSGGSSSVYLDMPALSTTYYFSIYPYVTTSNGELTGDIINTSRATSGQSVISITSTRTYSVPVGYSKMDVFCVGGGSGGTGAFSDSSDGGGGGGGGYTKTVTGIAVSGGQSLSITVGAGTTSAGGTSKVIRNNISLCEANGGKRTSALVYGNDGGSGGGGGAIGRHNAGVGGSNGGNGGASGGSNPNSGGYGQGTTTRAWGSSSGTLYAGGGGGGASGEGGFANSGGSGGGGSGNAYFYVGVNGATNTGGGGGGCGRGAGENAHSSGGSGIVLLRFY